MTRLRIRVLGGFAVQPDGGPPAALAGQKVQALLAFLALHPGQAQPRAKLMALLWGDFPDRQAAQSLRRALYLVRRALGGATDALIVDGDRVALDAAAVEVDALDLQRLAGAPEPECWMEALALYRGELLEGIDAGSPAFEDWLRGERQRLFELAVQGAGRLLAYQLRTGQDDAALRTASRLVAMDSAQETVHRALMRLHLRQGRRAAALRQYQACLEALRRELGTEPEAETTELYLEALRGGGPSGAGGGPRPEPAAGAAGSVPLVGRDAELSALLRALADARDGRGRLVLVAGEAGIGKTRLLDELREAALVLGARVLVGQCHETEQVLPFRPLIEALRAGGLPADGALVAALSPAARAALARLLPELADAREAAATGFADPSWLFEALLELCERAAPGESLVLLLEDIHWADEMTARWLAFAGRRLDGRRVLLAGTMREEEVEDAPALGMALRELAHEPQVLRLGLAALSEGETQELVRAMVHGRDRATAVASSVWELSDGNPFVIVEAVREILEHGSVAAAGGAGVPRRVRELIEARLLRLGEPIRHVMAVAAVAGEPVGFDLLSRAAAMAERPAAEAVEQLVRRRILHSVGDRLAFSHDRLREIAYRALLPARRQALHRAVGEALEASPGDPAEDLADRLAHHFSQARVADRAVSYLARCAETARRRNAVDEAMRALDHALALLDGIPEPTRLRVHLDLLLRKAFLLALRNGYRAGLALLAPHRARMEALGDPAIAGPYYFRLGMSHAHLGNLDEARALGWQTIEEGTRAGDRAIVGLGHHLLAFRSHLGGTHFREGAEHARQAVTHLAEAGETHYRGLAHWVLAHHLLSLGRFAQALESVAQIAAIAERLREPRLYSFAAAGALVRATMGDWEEAVRECEQTVERATDAVADVLILSSLGFAHSQGGDPDRAIDCLQRAIARMRSLDVLRISETRFGAFLADAYLARGDVARARQEAAAALALAEEIGYPWGGALAERALGRAAHAAGDAGTAVAHLRAARERFAVLEGAFEAARTAFYLAGALHALGQPEESAAAIGEARRAFVDLGVPVWERRAADLARRIARPG